MELYEIINHVKKIENRSEHDFINTLEERKIEEINHSDTIHAPKEITGKTDEQIKIAAKSRPVYETNIKVRNYISNWIEKEVRNKVVVDLACGSGEVTKIICQNSPTLVIGTELAPLTVKTNREKFATYFKNVYFILDDAEKSELPSNFADIIICSGMLHHVDLEKAISEIKRILKPNGKMFAIEALKHNPVFNWYRKSTPQSRTHWEAAHILGINDAKYISKHLQLKKIKYWQLFSILAIFFPKKIRNFFLKIFNSIDSVILRIPYIQLMAWIFTLEYQKK